MPSKAQGLSLNTIVIAAIVLIVLLILVGMTTGYFGKWGGSFGKLSDTSCKGQGGTPKPSCDSAIEKESFGETEQNMKCCVKKTCPEADGKCVKICSDTILWDFTDSCAGSTTGGICCKQ